VDYGQEEAQNRFGADPRTFSITTEEFLGDAQGHVRELRTAMVEWVRDANGRFGPKKISGTEKVRQADLVLLALGFLGPEDTLIEQLGVARDERSNVQAAYNQYTTSVPGVFAAGDMRRGQSLVVWALHEGRGAARACDQYLMGTTNLP
jgi:glutamate synthase (NADPH/NADH) small chain